MGGKGLRPTLNPDWPYVMIISLIASTKSLSPNKAILTGSRGRT